MEKDLIIKALECCYTPIASDCNDCGYRGQSVENGEYISCSNRLMADALTLIKQLTEENKRLGIENFDLICELSRIKENTAREMQTIISEKYAVSKVHYVENEEATITYQLTNWDLRVIAKELLEGEK